MAYWPIPESYYSRSIPLSSVAVANLNAIANFNATANLKAAIVAKVHSTP